jgi:seryl-tRNA synthetase
MEKRSPEFLKNVAELKIFSLRVKEAEAKIKEVEDEWRSLYLSIPNIPHESVPVDKTEKDTVTIARRSSVDDISPHAIPHYVIKWFADAVDFSRGIKATGSGFLFYRGDMARFVRAL